ncbi:unnamed protein product [Chrysoparadoxa australica]
MRLKHNRAMTMSPSKRLEILRSDVVLESPPSSPRSAQRKMEEKDAEEKRKKRHTISRLTDSFHLTRGRSLTTGDLNESPPDPSPKTEGTRIESTRLRRLFQSQSVRKPRKRDGHGGDGHLETLHSVSNSLEAAEVTENPLERHRLDAAIAKALGSPTSSKAHRRAGAGAGGEDENMGSDGLDSAVAGVLTDLPSMLDVLKDRAGEPFTLESFREFSQKQLLEENVDFWLAVEAYKMRENVADADLEETAKHIAETYIIAGAELEVNLSSHCRIDCLNLLKEAFVHDKETGTGTAGCTPAAQKCSFKEPERGLEAEDEAGAENGVEDEPEEWASCQDDGELLGETAPGARDGEEATGPLDEIFADTGSTGSFTCVPAEDSAPKGTGDSMACTSTGELARDVSTSNLGENLLGTALSEGGQRGADGEEPPLPVKEPVGAWGSFDDCSTAEASCDEGQKPRKGKLYRIETDGSAFTAEISPRQGEELQEQEQEQQPDPVRCVFDIPQDEIFTLICRDAYPRYISGYRLHLKNYMLGEQADAKGRAIVAALMKREKAILERKARGDKTCDKAKSHITVTSPSGEKVDCIF